MAWVKLSDDFTENRKILAAGPLAGWLWVCAIAWSNRNGTDGFVPYSQVPRLAAFDDVGMYTSSFTGEDVNPHKLADMLVDVVLFEVVEGGYEIHDYSQYQLTVAAMRDRKAQKAAAGQAGGRASAQARGEARASAGAPASAQAESKPNSQLPKPSSPHPRREDVDTMCDLLADLVEGNGCRRPAVRNEWRTQGRLLLDKDGINRDEAERVLRWALADPFWSTNILSIPKFREKFDQLQLKSRQHTAPEDRDAEFDEWAKR